MSGEVIATLLALITYALCVLTPIIPALLIYKYAPGSTVAVSGPLSKLSIRATGAVGAYIIFFILGEIVIINILNKIDAIPHPTMQVQAEVRLVDSNDDPINDPTALKTVQIYISPDLHSVSEQYVVISIPGAIGERWPHPFITFMADNYINRTIDLCKIIRDGGVRFERGANYLELVEPIELKRKTDVTYSPHEHLPPSAATVPLDQIKEAP